MSETPTTPEPLHACAVVLPALVDHPGNVAWQRAFELAHANEAALHVLHPVDSEVEGQQDRERALIAAERGLEQWVRGRTIGTSIAPRVTLHLTWQSDTVRALEALVSNEGVETIVLGATDDLRPALEALLDRLPCSVLVATERALEGLEAPASERPGILLRSAPLALPAPMPASDVVSDAVG